MGLLRRSNVRSQTKTNPNQEDLYNMMKYMKQALTNSMALLLAKNSCTRMLQSCLGFKAPELLSGAHR